MNKTSKQEFYKDDIVYLELSAGVHAKVKVLEVKFAYGDYRYVVQPVDTEWQMTVERLSPFKKIKV